MASRLHASCEASSIEVQRHLASLLALIDNAKDTLELEPLLRSSGELVEGVKMANQQLAGNAVQLKAALSFPAEPGLGPARNNDERREMNLALATHLVSLPQTCSQLLNDAELNSDSLCHPGFAALRALKDHIVEPALAYLNECNDPAASRIRDGLLLNQAIASERDWAVCVASFEAYMHQAEVNLPLATALLCGSDSLGDVTHYRTLVNAPPDQDLSANTELPLYIEPPAHFHSVFSCPVSREETLASNPPVLLSCGHVIATSSMLRLARNRQRFKCPTCPSNEETVEGALSLVL